MSNEQGVNRETRMRLPLSFKGPLAKELKEAEGEGKLTSEDLYRAMVRNAEMLGAAQVMRTLGAGEKEEKKEGGDTRGPLRPFEEVTEAAKLFGIDFRSLVESKDKELLALREATSEKERELHEMRLKQLQDMEGRVRALVEGTRAQAEGRDVGDLLGVGGLDPEVKKQIQERAFGLAKLQSQDGDVARPPTFFTPEWFQVWEQMKPGAELMARALGYVPPDQASRAKEPGPLISLEDMAEGKNVPIDLALGLEKLRLENKREELRIDREHEREMKRQELLAGVKKMAEDNLPDAWAAMRDMAGGYNRAGERRDEGEGMAGGEQAREPTAYWKRCSQCGETFALSEEKETCICPACGAELGVPHAETGGEGTH